MAHVTGAMTPATTGRRYWWLVWDEAQWGMGRLPVGETLRFASHDGEAGRWRSLPNNFKEIAVGDGVLGYQKRVGVVARLVLVGSQPAAIGSVPDTEGFVLVFRKEEQVEPIPLARVKQSQCMAASEPIRMNCLGSLFKLSPDEYAAMDMLIGGAASVSYRQNPSVLGAHVIPPVTVAITASRKIDPIFGVPAPVPVAKRRRGDAGQSVAVSVPKKRVGGIPEMTSSELGRVAEIFFGGPVEREFKLERFRLDHYCDTWKVAVEYDGPEHYSEVGHVERDERKEKLCRERQITLKRWPYYLQLTRDVARWFWGAHYTDLKFEQVMRLVYKTTDESQILASGLHKSRNTPANYVERGRQRFLAELDAAPASVRSQVVRSFQLYQERVGVGREWLLLPEGDARFERLMQHAPRPEHLNCVFPATVRRGTSESRSPVTSPSS